MILLSSRHLNAEVNLQQSTIWMAGLYLMLLLQFLENKVAVELTRSEFVEAQEVRLLYLFELDVQRSLLANNSWAHALQCIVAYPV